MDEDSVALREAPPNPPTPDGTSGSEGIQGSACSCPGPGRARPQIRAVAVCPHVLLRRLSHTRCWEGGRAEAATGSDAPGLGTDVGLKGTAGTEWRGSPKTRGDSPPTQGSCSAPRKSHAPFLGSDLSDPSPQHFPWQTPRVLIRRRPTELCGPGSPQLWVAACVPRGPVRLPAV